MSALTNKKYDVAYRAETFVSQLHPSGSDCFSLPLMHQYCGFLKGFSDLIFKGFEFNIIFSFILFSKSSLISVRKREF